MEGRAKDVQDWGKVYISRQRPPLLAARGVHHSDWLGLIWFLPVFCPSSAELQEMCVSRKPSDWVAVT